MNMISIADRRSGFDKLILAVVIYFVAAWALKMLAGGLVAAGLFVTFLTFIYFATVLRFFSGQISGDDAAIRLCVGTPVAGVTFAWLALEWALAAASYKLP